MTTPTIAEARAFGKKHGQAGVVIVFHDGAHAGYVSWGETKAECGWMRRYADRAYPGAARDVGDRAVKIIDDIIDDVFAADEPAITPERLRVILKQNLVPHEAVAGAEPLICYFKTAADREEFIAAVHEAKPNMRSVKL